MVTTTVPIAAAAVIARSRAFPPSMPSAISAPFISCRTRLGRAWISLWIWAMSATPSGCVMAPSSAREAVTTQPALATHSPFRSRHTFAREAATDERATRRPSAPIRERFPQCAEEERLKGYVIGTHRDEFFVQGPGGSPNTLGFFVEAVDPAYEDEFGGPEMQILGVSTCGNGELVSHHVVYLVGLSDPESTLPGDRFMGTYESVERDGAWAIGVTYVGLYTDWKLVLDDPLSEIACGHILPWG